MICNRLQIIVVCLSLIPLSVSAESVTGKAAMTGRDIVFSRNKGNCISCHAIEGSESPGNIGPPLVHIQKRFPDKRKLRAQIWDATMMNTESSMPPFGRFKIISESEIDLVTEFIWTL